MPNRSRKTKPEPAAKRTAKPQQKRDENQMAFDTLQQIMKQTEGTGKNPLAVALGRLGGLKGGKARAEKLTDAQRSESASMAAKARWEAKRKSAR